MKKLVKLAYPLIYVEAIWRQMITAFIAHEKHVILNENQKANKEASRRQLKISGRGFEVGNKADEVSHQKSSGGGFEVENSADIVSHKSTASLTQTIVCFISNLQQFPKLLELTWFEEIFEEYKS